MEKELKAKALKKDGSPRAVLLSKRANVFYLQHARVYQVGARVVYQTDTGEDVSGVFNIPDKNTIFLLLGRGTSITNAAVRTLSESNVVIGFTGSGGSPLISCSDPVFLSPQEEYRPTAYMQNWVKMWLDENKRLLAAKALLTTRIQITETLWQKQGLHISDKTLDDFKKGIQQGKSTEDLLLAEAQWAKSLYATLCQKYKVEGFARTPGKSQKRSEVDTINSFLDHGNYLAYGYAAACLHILGISYAFPILHGKTRRGALVFDIADLFKDGIIMPLAFSHGKNKSTDQEFRGSVINSWQKEKAIDQMIDKIKELGNSPEPNPF